LYNKRNKPKPITASTADTEIITKEIICPKGFPKEIANNIKK
jgi:hypothetical protein